MDGSSIDFNIPIQLSTDGKALLLNNCPSIESLNLAATSVIPNVSSPACINVPLSELWFQSCYGSHTGMTVAFRFAYSLDAGLKLICLFRVVDVLHRFDCVSVDLLDVSLLRVTTRCHRSGMEFMKYRHVFLSGIPTIQLPFLQSQVL